MSRLPATGRGAVVNGSFPIRRIDTPYPLPSSVAFMLHRQDAETSSRSVSSEFGTIHFSSFNWSENRPAGQRRLRQNFILN